MSTCCNSTSVGMLHPVSGAHQKAQRFRLLWLTCMASHILILCCYIYIMFFFPASMSQVFVSCSEDLLTFLINAPLLTSLLGRGTETDYDPVQFKWPSETWLKLVPAKSGQTAMKDICVRLCKHHARCLRSTFVFFLELVHQLNPVLFQTRSTATEEDYTEALYSSWMPNE